MDLFEFKRYRTRFPILPFLNNSRTSFSDINNNLKKVSDISFIYKYLHLVS